MSIESNILTPPQYQRFLYELEEIPSKRSPINGKVARLCFEFMEDTGLRVNETIHVKNRDVDFSTRILTVTEPKSERECKCSKWIYKDQYSRSRILDKVNEYCLFCHGKGKWKKPQKTTITPRIFNELKEYCSHLKEDDLLFPISRQSLWNWGKEAGIRAKIDIFQQKDERLVKGIFLHLFRAICSLRMEADSKNDLHQKGLIKCKLRHSTKRDVTDRYTQIDINYLLKWENGAYDYTVIE
jgi:integrase